MAEDRKEVERRGSRRELSRYVAPVVIAGLLLWFALANAQRVAVDFIVTTREARLIWVIVVCVGLGVAIGALAARRRRR